MNWIDYLIIFIIIINIIRSTNIGLVRSIFSFIRFLASIYLAKLYYPVISEYIMNTPVLYNIFKKLFEGISKLLFYGKIKENQNLLYDMVSDSLIKMGITIFSIIIIYTIIRWLLGYLERAISFLFKAPILKQLNIVGGFLFGLIRGMVIVYLIFAIFIFIQSIYPGGTISKALEGSLFSGYFKNNNLIIDFFNIKQSQVNSILPMKLFR